MKSEDEIVEEAVDAYVDCRTTITEGMRAAFEVFRKYYTTPTGCDPLRPQSAIQEKINRAIYNVDIYEDLWVTNGLTLAIRATIEAIELMNGGE